MEYIVTASEMRRADENTISYFGIPQLVLMERAALAARDAICESWPGLFRAEISAVSDGLQFAGAGKEKNSLRSAESGKEDNDNRSTGSGKRDFGSLSAGRRTRILIAIGNGNNGGDGAALARLFFLRGCEVTVLVSGEAGKYSEALKKQMEILGKYMGKNAGKSNPPDKANKSVESGGRLEIIDDRMLNAMPRTLVSRFDVVVDALFGIGLSREISGAYREKIEWLNSLSGKKAALDIPSGISAEDGRVLGCAFRADLTITFGFLKRGMLLYPGREICGEVRVADIGITEESFLGKCPAGMTIGKGGKSAQEAWAERMVSRLFPPRRADSHKGSYGKLLLAAGSAGMPGAALLSGEAAFRSGAGMLQIVSPAENRELILARLPEAMVCCTCTKTLDCAKAGGKAQPPKTTGCRAKALQSVEAGENAHLPETEHETALNSYDAESFLREDAASSPDGGTDWEKLLGWCDAVVMGPGIGQGAEASVNLETVLDLLTEDRNVGKDSEHREQTAKNAEADSYLKRKDMQNAEIDSYQKRKDAKNAGKPCKPIILDADALNLIASSENLLGKVREYALSGSIVIMTPHTAELARLLHCTMAELKADRMGLMEKYCEKNGVILVSKDAATVVGFCAENGEFRYYINQTGNSGMATAGSGDVLSGILGASVGWMAVECRERNLRREMACKSRNADGESGESRNCEVQDGENLREMYFRAVCRAVYLHGLAGDAAAEKYGKTSMKAGDMIRELPGLLKGV